MAGWTNRGKYNALKALHDGTSLPTNYYVALVTSTTAPAADINTMSELTEVSDGNGYSSGGISLGKNTTDFDVATEDDGNDKAYIQIRDLTWNASGGSISNARYAVLTNDAGTTVGSREVLYYWDLGSDKTISDGDSLTLKDLQIDLLES